MNSQKSLPEITVKAVLLGIVLAMVLAAANAYLGLFAGMTVSASIPAAVVSMGILRMFKNSNILENNIVQTAASAGESLAAGVIFTLPGLIILGFWDEFNFFWVSIIAGFGGVLGVLFTIPLRRSLIVEGDLKFPEGVATAEVLETGQKGQSGGVKHIAKAAIAGSLFVIGAKGIGFWPEVVSGAAKVKGSIAYFGSNLSPALLAVGYIVGLNIASLIFIGGGCNWFGAIPLVASQNDWPTYQLKSEVAEEKLDDWNLFALEYKTADEGALQADIEIVDEHNAKVTKKLELQLVDAEEYAKQIWSKLTRYLGVGGMLVGGLWTVFQMRGSLLSGITSGLKAYKNTGKANNEIPRTEKDMPMKWILILIIASIIPLYLVYQHFVGVKVAIPMAIIMLIAGFIFSAVAGYMAGLVGSSNNPISGVTIATIVVSSLLLVVLMGKDSPSGPAAAIIIGSVVCCAAAIAGDNMQDLKAGHIVGATPWRQQVMQLIGTISAALVIAPVLVLLQKAYGFAGTPGAGEKALAAPQANLMASVAKGVFEGNLPWGFVFTGMGIAVAVIILDLYLKSINSTFRTPVLAVAIGFYLPFQLSVPILTGGLIHHFVKKYQREKLSKEQADNANRNGLLFASGLITGEALTGIFMAIPIVILAKRDIALPMIGFGEEASGKLLGIIVVAAIAVWLLVTAMGSKTKND